MTQDIKKMLELDQPRALALYPGELVDETPGRGSIRENLFYRYK